MTKETAQHILIVDDNPTNRKLLIAIVEAEGYTTIEASDGAEALKLMDTTKVDAIISDILMPNMDGYRFCYEVRKNKKHSTLPFVLNTATYTSKNDEKLALELGADKILKKPVSSTELLQTLRELFSNPVYLQPRVITHPKTIEVITEYRDALVNKLEEKTVELQRTTEELKASEELFRLITENAADLIAVLDLEGKRLYNSPSYDTFFVDAKKLRGTDSFQDIHPDDRERIRKIFKDTVTTGMGRRDEFRFVLKDGTIRHIESQGSVVRDHEGRPEKVVVVSRDITERVKAEESLHKLSSAVEQAGDSIVITDKRGVIEYVNPAFESITGYSKHMVIGKTPKILKSGKQSKEYYKTLWQTILGGKVFRDIVINKKRNGDLFYEEQTITPIVDARGETIHFVSTGRDITERKMAEDALELANSQLRNLQDNLDEALFSIDMVQNKMLEVSIAHQAIFGYPPVEFFKNPQLWYELIIPEDKPVVEAGFPRLLSGKTLEHEFRITRPDGEIRWIEARIKPTLDANGKLVRIDGIASDITDRRRAEQEIRESEERFRQLTDTIKEVFWLTDPKKNEMLYISRGYEEIWDRTCESLLANPLSWAESIHSDDRDRVLKSTMSRQLLGTYDEEYRIVRPDGTIRWIQDKAFPIKDQSGKVIRVAGVAEDITERRSLEQQLRQAQKLESLGTLAGGISHDFNNILGIIMGHASLMSRHEMDRDRIARSTDAITKASHRGAGLVRQLLTFARKTEPSLESVSVNDIILELAKLFEETFPKTITISLSLGEGIPGIVGDSSQLHQTILNLCVNARDAMPDGGTLTVETSVLSSEIVRSEFADASEHKHVCISASDTGIGMDETTRQRIFEPFFTTKGIGKGTGLGLAVVYGIVKSLDGQIGVESFMGKGTTFRLYFPVIERNSPAFEATTTEPASIPGGKETILVVEDEEMLMDLISTLLEAKGYHVLQARDGEEAVKTYKGNANSISLVITDLGLPKLDGQKAFLKMKKINSYVNAVIATGYISREQRSAILGSGVKDIIMKPYVPTQVLNLVREVIDRKPDAQ